MQHPDTTGVKNREGQVVRSIRLSRRTLGIGAGVVALVLATLGAAVTVLAIEVEGVSMAPTLDDGERVLLEPFSGGDTPDRFAIVVTRFSERGPTVVKRVVGLPGDRVRITGSVVEVQPGGAGAWLVADLPGWGGDGIATTVPACCRPDGKASVTTEPQTVPAGMLFLLGDDPSASEDSRSFGWAPVAEIAGVVGWRLRAWVLPAGVDNHASLTPR